MPNITEQQYQQFEEFITLGVVALHASKLKKLQKLKLEEILYKKNIYLFKTKYLQTPEELVRNIFALPVLPLCYFACLVSPPTDIRSDLAGFRGRSYVSTPVIPSLNKEMKTIFPSIWDRSCILTPLQE